MSAGPGDGVPKKAESLQEPGQAVGGNLSPSADQLSAADPASGCEPLPTVSDGGAVFVLDRSS